MSSILAVIYVYKLNAKKPTTVSILLMGNLFLRNKSHTSEDTSKAQSTSVGWLQHLSES